MLLDKHQTTVLRISLQQYLWVVIYIPYVLLISNTGIVVRAIRQAGSQAHFVGLKILQAENISITCAYLRKRDEFFCHFFNRGIIVNNHLSQTRKVSVH